MTHTRCCHRIQGNMLTGCDVFVQVDRLPSRCQGLHFDHPVHAGHIRCVPINARLTTIDRTVVRLEAVGKFGVIAWVEEHPNPRLPGGLHRSLRCPRPRNSLVVRAPASHRAETTRAALEYHLDAFRSQKSILRFQKSR